MKKNFSLILGAFLLVDAVVLGFWWQSRKNTPAAPPIPIPEATPNSSVPDPAKAAPQPSPASADAFLYGPGKSPGGCASLAACEQYCAKPETAQECLDWTKRDQNGGGTPSNRPSQTDAAAIDPAPLADLTPGACLGKGCLAYCRRPENEAECQDYCANPKNHGACKSWGELPPAVKAVMTGALVAD